MVYILRPFEDGPGSFDEITLLRSLLIKEIKESSGIASLIRSRMRFDDFLRIRTAEYLESLGFAVSADVPSTADPQKGIFPLGWIPSSSADAESSDESVPRVSVADILTLNTWYKHSGFKDVKRSISETYKTLEHSLSALAQSGYPHAHLIALIYPADPDNARLKDFYEHVDSCIETLSQTHGLNTSLSDAPESRWDYFQFKSDRPHDSLPGRLLHVRFSKPTAQDLDPSTLLEGWFFPPPPEPPKANRSKSELASYAVNPQGVLTTLKRSEDSSSVPAVRRSSASLISSTGKGRPSKIRSLLPPHAYRDCLREVRSGMLESNEVLTMAQVCEQFETIVQRRVEKALAARWKRTHSDETRSDRSLVDEEPDLKAQRDELLRAFDSGGSGSKYMKVHLYTINSPLRVTFKSKLAFNAAKDAPNDYNFFAFLMDESTRPEGDLLPYMERKVVAFDPGDPRLGNEPIYHEKPAQSGEEPKQITVSDAYPDPGSWRTADSLRAGLPATHLPTSRVLESSNPYSYAGKITGSDCPMTLASRIWVAMALLHKEHPDQDGFKLDAIRAKLAELFYDGDLDRLEPGIPIHLSGHLVARPDPNAMNKPYLTSVSRGVRRLFRPADSPDVIAEGGNIRPSEADLMPDYQDLIAWYDTEYARGSSDA